MVISLPDPPKDRTLKVREGEAYTPSFAYNPGLAEFARFRIAYKLLERWTYKDYAHALAIFSDVWDGGLGHPSAGLGFVEALCKFSDREWRNPLDADTYSVAISILDKLRERADRYWRFWAVSAFLEKVVDDDGLAASFFKRALSLDRNKTESYVPYIAFLFETRETEAALGLMNRYLYERMEDSNAYTQAGLLLATAGRLEGGMKLLHDSLLLDSGNCGAHEFIAVLHFIEGNREEYEKHMNSLRALCDEISFNVTALFFEKHAERHGRLAWMQQRLGQGS